MGPSPWTGPRRTRSARVTVQFFKTVHGYVIFFGPPRLIHGLCGFGRGVHGLPATRIRFDLCDPDPIILGLIFSFSL